METTAAGSVSARAVDGADPSVSGAMGAATGTYGALAMSGADWTYTLSNSDADTDALDAGDSVTDAFTITVTETSSSSTDTMTVTITITGADDASVWAGTSTGSLTEDASTTTASGALTISDVDGGDTPTITDVSSTAGANGYGNFVMASGTWTYTIDSSATDALDAGDSVTDTYAFEASDTTTQTVTILSLLHLLRSRRRGYCSSRCAHYH